MDNIGNALCMRVLNGRKSCQVERLPGVSNVQLWRRHERPELVRFVARHMNIWLYYVGVCD